MLAVAPSRNTTKDHEGIDSADIQFGSCSGFTINPEEFPEFSDHGSLLESIDFDDLFDDGDILPDLEIDPDIFTDFSGSSSTSDNNNNNNNNNIVDVDAAYGADIDEKSVLEKGDEVVSKREDNGTKRESGEKKRKCSSSSGKAKNNKDNNQGKRKVKVDWTPELHRRFVQAVEQLGVDKAVPSRILELMGVHCLTRHNVASHLQKYRSHRKHLLAREAEAASWTRKRQMYGAAPVAEGGGKNGRGSGGGGSGLIAPTIGFPQPMMPPPMMHHHHRPHYGPLHVWGHPTVDQSLMQNMWPKHLAHTGSPPPPSPAYPPMWVPPSAMWVPSISTPGSPCFAQPIAAPTTRFGAPPVPGFPPPPHHGKYKAAPVGLHPGKSGPPPPADFYPSKESIDAAIGDALTKPWLPFPLGLKPPAVDSVMVELHRHGVSMVPPSDENAKKDKKEKN